MKRKKVDHRIVMTAILGLVTLEVVALLTGVNGTLFTMIIAIIAGLAGWAAPTPKFK